MSEEQYVLNMLWNFYSINLCPHSEPLKWISHPLDLGFTPKLTAQKKRKEGKEGKKRTEHLLNSSHAARCLRQHFI